MTEKTNDPARDFLDSSREATFDAERCKRRAEELRTQCEHITAQISSAPGGGGDVHKDSLWAALADECVRMTENYKEAVHRGRKVEDFINLLDNPNHRMILKLRYVDLMRWPRVLIALQGMNLYYSERQMYRLHGEALNAARQLWADTHPGEGETA